MKTRLELLQDLLETNQRKLIGDEIDLALFNRKNLISKEPQITKALEVKISQIKAQKAYTEEAIAEIEKMIKDELKKDKLIN
jgi:hypothetical protein